MQNTELSKLSIEALVSKRKARWEELHDIEYDRKLRDFNAYAILKDEQLRNEVINKPYLLIECCFCIVDKRKNTVPFFFNEVQRDFICKLEKHGTKKPFFILKGRQQGFTTVITAIQLAFAVVRKNFSGFTLADKDDNTKAIFTDKAKFMYNALPDILKPHEKFNSVNEIFFDKLNSSWRIASATPNVGRSRTLNFIHYSEAAFYRCGLSSLQKSINEAAVSDAIRIYETTANGFNEAKDLWDQGSCVNIFYEWWRTPEYECDDISVISRADGWLSQRIEFLRKRGINDNKIAWYCSKYYSYVDPTAIKQEYPCTPEEAFISSGDCVFDKEAISNYLTVFNVPYRLGYFEYRKENTPVLDENGRVADYESRIKDIVFREDRNGYIRIVENPYKEVKNGVERIKPYVIGADTAGTGNDYFTAKVIDNTNGRCVATLQKQRMDEDLYAEQLYCLGMFYNEAFIAVEVNYSIHPIRVLRSLGYTNLYVSSILGTQGDKKDNKYGFLTTRATRSVIVNNLVTTMRDDITLETDRETLKEMTTFIRRYDGKSAATDGAHDDLVMASAIARFAAIGYTRDIEVNKKAFVELGKMFNMESISHDTYVEW
ncbi:MAG: hypothetical protein IJW19_05075 [Clostridia bacterium]|nr:hypothetical protein [Clostridia bacterium]